MTEQLVNVKTRRRIKAWARVTSTVLIVVVITAVLVDFFELIGGY